MYTFKSRYFSDIYHDVLNTVRASPEYSTSPRGQKVNEITNAVIEVSEPNYNLYVNKRRSSKEKYIAAETIWYFNGQNTTEFISKYANMWNHIKNDDNMTVNSCYGYQLFTDKNNKSELSEWEWSFRSLLNDKDTRQAVMKINKPSHNIIGIKDYPCTLTITFMIRDNKLNMTVHMRSNDIVLGLPTDFALFNIMHQQMYNQLKYKYDTLNIGKYTHIVDSLHLYERNFGLVEDMLQHEFFPRKTPHLDLDLIDFKGRRSSDIYSLYIGEYNTCSTSKFYNYLFEKIS